MQVGFIGSGNMASALARGWGEPVLCRDSGSGRAAALAGELGGEALSNREVAERADVLVLAHKPAQLEAVAAEIGSAAKAVVSILAARPRPTCGPPTPACRCSAWSPTPRPRSTGVLAFAEPDEPVDADLYPRCVTASPGSAWSRGARAADGGRGRRMGVAPAYWALLSRPGSTPPCAAGMPVAAAKMLVTGGMAGSAELLRHYDGDTLTLRRAVASPGGSTARGLAALEAAGVRAALSRRDGRGDGLMEARQEIADFLGALFFVYRICIVAWIVASFVFSLGAASLQPRPNAMLDFLRDVSDPYLRIFRGFGWSSARSTSARSSRSSCCASSAASSST